MGLFSSSKKTYVSSTVYNLAGPIEDRSSFFKTVFVREILTRGPQTSLGTGIVRQQMTGPASVQRNFFRWAKDNYPDGVLSGSISNQRNIDAERLRRFIPVPAGKKVVVLGAHIDSGDFIYWVEKHILETKPELFDQGWSCDIATGTNQVGILYPDSSTEVIVLQDYNPSKDYVFAYYSVVNEDGSGPTQSQSVFIYELGSGVFALDLLDVKQKPDPEYYPVIPLRVDNHSIRHPNFNAHYALFEKAYKKAIGSDIGDILDSIEDNDQIGDIDYAYLVHGVELNTQENEGKRFLYEYLRGLESYQNRNSTPARTWMNQTNTAYENFVAQLTAWESDQASGGPLFGTTMPQNKVREMPDMSRIDIQTPGTSGFAFRFTLSWAGIEETIGIGVGKTGAKVGDIWWDTSPANIQQAGMPIIRDGSVRLFNGHKFEHNRLYWQDKPDSYRWLDIYDLVHENHVYGNKSVRITVQEALAESDESGFMIPLHEPSLRKMSLVARNELVLSSRQIVLNSYQVVTTKWYQKTIFKVIFAIILTVVFAPAGIGLLGAHVAVGTALGFAGTTALIVGATANIIAAIVLTSIIQAGATELFGDKIGAIVTAVVMMYTMQYVGGLHLDGAGSFNWGDMMKAENLLRLTDSVASGIQGFAQAEQADLMQQGADAFASYNSSMSDIENKSKELLGYGGAVIDPLMLLDMQDSSLRPMESSRAFLSRTLMTGSEIASLSFVMIESYVDLNLRLPTHDE